MVNRFWLAGVGVTSHVGVLASGSSAICQNLSAVTGGLTGLSVPRMFHADVIGL